MQFPVGADTFRALPRHPDWTYEYLDGWAHLHYRPAPLDLIRDLSGVIARGAGPGRRDDPRGLVVTPMAPTDHDELVALVDLVWDELDPYRVRRAFAAARDLTAIGGAISAGGVAGPVAETAGFRFARTLAGEDDPWDPAVLVARAGGGTGPVAGLVTLAAWRREDRTQPAELSITWLTVAPRWRRAGVATALLAAAVSVARETAASELHSAVSGANTPSVCWHWVNGFRPLPRVG